MAYEPPVQYAPSGDGAKINERSSGVLTVLKST
jgi:hypothetical protein